jgi:hypothetical protein
MASIGLSVANATEYCRILVAGTTPLYLYRMICNSMGWIGAEAGICGGTQLPCPTLSTLPIPRDIDQHRLDGCQALVSIVENIFSVPLRLCVTARCENSLSPESA